MTVEAYKDGKLVDWRRLSEYSNDEERKQYNVWRNEMLSNGCTLESYLD